MRASGKRGSMGESELKKGGQCVHAPPSPIFRECPPLWVHNDKISKVPAKSNQRRLNNIAR